MSHWFSSMGFLTVLGCSAIGLITGLADVHDPWIVIPLLVIVALCIAIAHSRGEASGLAQARRIRADARLGPSHRCPICDTTSSPS